MITERFKYDYKLKRHLYFVINRFIYLSLWQWNENDDIDVGAHFLKHEMIVV